jgi:hypothetical protein
MAGADKSGDDPPGQLQNNPRRLPHSACPTACTHCPTHPCEPAPCAAAMSTTTSPPSRPMQAPMSSMGTNTPLAMALPAAGECSGGGAHL